MTNPLPRLTDSKRRELNAKALATKHHDRWTEEEKEYVIWTDDLITDQALKLGRTPQAVKAKRHRHSDEIRAARAHDIENYL